MKTQKLAVICLAIGLIGENISAQVIPSARKVEWLGQVGVQGDIPYRNSKFTSVTDAPYYAAGNGTSDDSNAIQSAINNCPTGQVVYLPAGTYRITRSIRMKSGITLRGAGIGATVIQGASSFSGSYLIGFEKEGMQFDLTYDSVKSISGGLIKGSNNIVVSTAGWNAGDIVLIDQLRDASGDPAITNIGTDGTCTWSSRESGNRPIGQVVKIDSVAGAARISTPLYYSFSSSFSPEAARIRPAYITSLSGVEELTLDNSRSYGQSQGNYGVVYMACTSECWLLNVEVYTTYKTGIKVLNSYRDTIRGCTIHKSYAYTADAGYGLLLTYGVSACLIENNMFYDLTAGVIYNGPVSGNVISYNYFTSMINTTYPNAIRNGLIAHGGHPIMNLFESNYLEGPGISCDLYWGSSSHNTYLRNAVILDQAKTVGTADISIWKMQTYYNFIGNVLGSRGYENQYENDNLYGGKMIYNLDFTNSGVPDGRTASTMIRHGNYDAATGSVIWDSGISDRTIPRSYYLLYAPSWWSGLPWPAIGPDLDPMKSDIPAKHRAGSISPSSKSLQSPTRLRIRK